MRNILEQGFVLEQQQQQQQYNVKLIQKRKSTSIVLFAKSPRHYDFM